ncbi:MAG TPA: TerC/Alx family metal homeostasis membrane protein [Polyangiaceae bacterium LLY-WYZ-15_(1-7)]|nr:TerC/Alx family metal homeostasis membrane protein [Polyangiaceae bacterium LLY-WYZ-15_(1-7)]HJL05587.1 TerC/Alx family metal homeostasis membrane protein [Polyangiaceae bacterium LLY-WYZ-15_(1-7)]HJL08843.1 TerC/Alx family metal homeostasis membrane protein [Polyangiaceae bacterium LLY-WYZ-15_(1-7)]HJL26046.1 TerC/Alx family metal homeostasis membrane protein [Polyangiaceae bacterium LLY-WYZ-15_(1-7)]HJL36337.1 TerC/Alx family metal homeostasis membrane protein [Polyangiaceae bacterium LLY-
MIWLWGGFLVLVAIMLAIDLGVFHKEAHAVSAREALGWTAVWITLGLSFTGFVWAVYEHGWFGAHLLDDAGQPLPHEPGQGLTAAARYVTAYLLEKSLSVDNIFVIALVFDRFGVAPIHRHRVLFWGVLGAIVMRGAMLLGGLWLLHHFTWLFYVFGGYLAFTGFKMLLPEKGEEEESHGEGFTAKLRRWLHVAPDEVEHHGHFFVELDGKRVLSALGLTLIVIEWTDLVFALDSIPAVLAVAPEPFIVFTSNIFAILGLRSLYFVLERAIHEFRELKVALAIVLMFIGAKMFAHEWFHVPNWISLTVIVSTISIAIGLSLVRRRLREEEEHELHESLHPNEGSAEGEADVEDAAS